MEEKDSRMITSFYEASSNVALLLLKTLLILNSGALGSILFFASRSENSRTVNVLVEGSINFWWGLAGALVSILFYTPVSSEFSELGKIFRKRTPSIIVSAFLTLFSLAMFLYGSWGIIQSLRQALSIGQ